MRVVFKNGSKLDIVAASQRTRGGRRHGGLIEEANKIALTHFFPDITGGQLLDGSRGKISAYKIWQNSGKIF